MKYEFNRNFLFTETQKLLNKWFEEILFDSRLDDYY